MIATHHIYIVQVMKEFLQIQEVLIKKSWNSQCALPVRPEYDLLWGGLPIKLKGIVRSKSSRGYVEAGRDIAFYPNKLTENQRATHANRKKMSLSAVSVWSIALAVQHN